MKQFELQGKVAIITGASKGIGEAIARLFAHAGAKVVVSSRNLESVQQIARSVIEDGGQALAVAAHTGIAAQLGELVEKTVAHFGSIDILVNNAATNPVFGPALHTGEDAFDKIMAVNVKGPFLLCQKAYPELAKRGGSIINISSIGGLSPEEYLGIYSVSKAALISLTKVLAKEWGNAGIRVNAICPGLIKTKFSKALWDNEKMLERFTRNLPLARIGTPEEIAALALFLASEAAGYCTGAVFTADGGYTI
ncbi:3-oxoacyl-ACP reductase [Sphingobacteriales bacterium UPWRP_1]|nr:short-chain dehydrogenase [Sphingobacteriales bacterium TSM_CSS]PSJ73146.1 3-oxoacyl-ACP reductase [Sphingobacteriales bacterium UPWRP_1]